MKLPIFSLSRTAGLFLSMFLMLMLPAITLKAQYPAGTAPASSNIKGLQYPRVDDAGRAYFQIKAPQAQTMQIRVGKSYDMKKDTSGTWTVTTDPLDPGFHYYSLVVNGVAVVDPASETFYGSGRMYSGIEIPEKGVNFYDVKAVPHGDVRLMNYYSAASKSWRQLYVYTPPGYDANTSVKYPVLYIQHGGGEDERGWIVQGRTPFIMDNLLAENKIKPMLVVVGNGNVTSAGGYTDDAMNAFKQEMVGNIVPFIEKTFRVLANRENRALAGLSMGGGQAFYTGLKNSDEFASVASFSSGIFGGIAGANFDAEKQVPGILSKSDTFNKKLKLFYLSVGEQDPRFEPTKKVVATFRESKLKVKFNSFPGGHEWQVWRKSLHDLAPLLFR